MYTVYKIHENVYFISFADDGDCNKHAEMILYQPGSTDCRQTSVGKKSTAQMTIHAQQNQRHAQNNISGGEILRVQRASLKGMCYLREET
jgi:hypothetical protein